MDSDHTTAPETRQPDNHGTNDASLNCQTRSVGDTGLLECATNIIGCQWALAFGNTRFCKHPSKQQFDFSSQP